MGRIKRKKQIAWSSNSYSSMYELNHVIMSPFSVEKLYCELCGDEVTDSNKVVGPLLCSPCEIKLWRKLLQKEIPEGSKVHCPICLKHIKACKCPESESLRQMAQ